MANLQRLELDNLQGKQSQHWFQMLDNRILLADSGNRRNLWESYLQRCCSEEVSFLGLRCKLLKKDKNFGSIGNLLVEYTQNVACIV